MHKRIAVLSYHTCPLSDERGTEIGGMNVYVLELSKQLAKKGYTIDIYTRCVDPASQKIVQVSQNLRVIHLHAGEEKKLPKKELINYLPDFTSSLFSFIEQEKLAYDTISAHYYLSGLIGLEMKKKYHLPLSITFHTLALMKNLVARSEAEKDDLSRIEAELMLVQKADRIFATSETDSQYLQTLYSASPEKVFVLTPGVDLEKFKPMDKLQAKKHIHADPSEKLILFVGRIEPLKGIDVLLYSIKILLQQNSGLRIAVSIVGGDISEKLNKWSAELQKLEKIREILQIGAVVTFVGQQNREELPYYYNAAEVVVMPSHYESFGTTALEAMASGTPVITTDAAGVSGLLDKQHNTLVTSANNPILLADKILRLLKDEKHYKQVSHEIYEKVQDVSWEKIAERFMKCCFVRP